jgi:hypothetical protein
MYRVVNVEKCVATDFYDLLNLDTGTLEKGVFDDSGMVSDNNFEFMQKGQTYDCKMELFGDFEDKKTDSNFEVSIVQKSVKIGNTPYFKVMIGKDVYYILESDAENWELKPKMFYGFSRKNLIQVDDMIHADRLC